MRANNLTQVLAFFALERTGLHGQNLRMWFIDRPTSPRHRLKQALLEARKQQRAEKLLLVGHRGCGKSTELNQLVVELDDAYLALNFDLLQATGRTTIGYEDLMLALATQIIRFCIDNKLFGRPLSDPLSDMMGGVRDWWLRIIAGLEIRAPGGVATYAELTTLLGELQLGVSQSSLTREQIRDRINQQMPELIRRVNLVVHEAQRTLGARRLLIIVEGLDKTDLESARNIFRDHAPTITAIDATTIFTFPLALRHADDYQQIRNTFEQKVRVLHNFAPRHPDGALDQAEVDLLKALVIKRTNAELIEAAALDYLVAMCGGIPSHLIQLVQNAVLFARQRDENARQITLADAKAAAKEMRDEMIIGLSSQEWDLLWARHQDHAPVNEPAMQRLFYKSALVEYTNDEPWCDVHPLLLGILTDRYGR